MIEQIRKEFPTLNQKINNYPLAYLDSAATTLKPNIVIDRITNHYKNEVSNVHRGIHTLSSKATDAYEATRTFIKKFINAQDEREIIFTKGTTESLNLVAYSYLLPLLKEGDEIIVTTMEHHSNLVPWQQIALNKKAKLIECPILDTGEIDLEKFKELLNEKTKLVSTCYISNTLGTINPVKEMIELTHEQGAKFCIDGAQSVAHLKTDVQDLDCDFFAFSGHKTFGPTGIGILFGKLDLLNQMLPFNYGGAMIEEVTFPKTTFLNAPEKFEAGTPHIAGVIGLHSALEFIAELDLDKLIHYEHELLTYLTDELNKIEDLTVIGTAKEKSSVASFHIAGVHPHDLGMLLDQQGVAVRTGHHCTYPIMKHFNVGALTRASLSIYNNQQDIDQLINSIKKAKELL